MESLHFPLLLLCLFSPSFLETLPALKSLSVLLEVRARSGGELSSERPHVGGVSVVLHLCRPVAGGLLPVGEDQVVPDFRSLSAGAISAPAHQPQLQASVDHLHDREVVAPAPDGEVMCGGVAIQDKRH
jgi:hypothetical protein